MPIPNRLRWTLYILGLWPGCSSCRSRPGEHALIAEGVKRPRVRRWLCGPCGPCALRAIPKEARHHPRVEA